MEKQGKSLYTSGISNKYIEENKNGDICLAYYDAGAVIVTDRARGFRIRYDGTSASQKGISFVQLESLQTV